jgi:hypothetical protein
LDLSGGALRGVHFYLLEVGSEPVGDLRYARSKYKSEAVGAQTW